MSGEVQIEVLNLKKSFQTSLKNGFEEVLKKGAFSHARLYYLLRAFF